MIRTYDNRDDRRELWRLLGRLTPRQRIEYLRWCCSRAACGRLRPTVARRSTGTEMETWLDLWALVGQWGLDMDVAAAELVRRVRAVGQADR